ncbi:NnrS family protein [Vibrio sp. JC009]|uniref:NnrS family protein n=1 Tax=Vibrio sp. JC009 TaxID=2912314 RepID=UPI0023B00E6F|nr:NnrS family protein [Vibrio sp. JC009]WED23845.1 NnrS family protein [Vibrio sp. JC009]
MAVSFFDSKSPLYACGFRPFFLLTAFYAVILAVYNVLFSGRLISDFPGAAEIWYLHELVYGVGGALIAGFLLTAFPAWTDTERVDSGRLMLLVSLWGISRLFALAVSYFGMLPVTLINSAFLLMLLAVLFHPITDKRQQRHRIFYYQLLLLFTVTLISYFFLLSDGLQQAKPWLQVCGGIFLIIVLTILSRMSMVVVNHALEKYQVTDERFLARPPRRNFAIWIILAFLAADLFLPGSSASGWLALACAAALLNILNDWHLPKAWRDLYYQALYLFYLLIAGGFVAIGINNISGAGDIYHSVYLLFICAAGIAALVIMLVVGQKHTGYTLSYQGPVLLMILSVLGLALALSGPVAGLYSLKMEQSLIAVFISLSFLLYLRFFWSRYHRRRVDGKQG